MSPAASQADTILLVEDEFSIRALVACSLERHGFKVLPARHGEEALQICREYTGMIHLVMTDLMLPRSFSLATGKRQPTPLDGIALIRQIVAIRPNIKVLIFSGHSDEVLENLGVMKAGLPFLRKPFGPETLVRTVRELLGVPPSP